MGVAVASASTQGVLQATLPTLGAHLTPLELFNHLHPDTTSGPLFFLDFKKEVPFATRAPPAGVPGHRAVVGLVVAGGDHDEWRHPPWVTFSLHEKATQ